MYINYFESFKENHNTFDFGSSSEIQQYFCSICKNILKMPRQTECGCRFCSSCLNRHLEATDNFCPNCKNFEIVKENIIVDRAIEKELNKQIIKCPKSECQAVCEFRQLIHHLSKFHLEKPEHLKSPENRPAKFYENIPSTFCQHLAHSTNQIREPKSNSIEKLKQKSQISFGKFDDVGNQPTRLESTLKRIEENIDFCWISESGPGQFIFHIPKVQEKIQNALDGGLNEISSVPFYIFHKGYRMVIKVYLIGDGNVHKISLSVYCILIKGDFDHFLRWPFNKKVVISSCCLFSQNLNVTILPNENPACYGRPIGCNQGFGEPSFIPISSLMLNNKFIIDGQLQLRFVFQN